MEKKKLTKEIKLQIPAGKATPAPPVGTALGPAGINLQEFCTKYNEATRDKMGEIVPVVIKLYDDRSFDFELKTPPVGFLLKQAAKIEKGSSKGANEIVATIEKSDVKEIAEKKMPDLNAYDIEAAIKIIEGSARNMGIAIKGVNDKELAQQAAEALERERAIARREAALEKAEAELESADIEDVEVQGEEDTDEEEISETEEEKEE